VHTDPAPNAKGFAVDRPWQDVEEALIRTLRALDQVGGEVGLTLSHVPFSKLGGPPGDNSSEDLSWEVLWSAATVVDVTYNGQPATAPSWDTVYALGGHPAAALDEATADLTPDGVTLTDEDVTLLARWRGWSDAFRDLAVRCSHLPLDTAGVDLTVGRDEGRASGWVWQVEIRVADDEWPASSWDANTFPELLQAVMAQEYRWAADLPAGHQLEDALREEAKETPGGASTS